LNQKELSIQCFLAIREAENGEFLFKLITAKISNAKYFVNSRRSNTAAELFSMTPQEELFTELFRDEKMIIHEMDDLSLEAHIEDLSKIAFEARARLTAAKDEKDERKKKRGKATGFSANVEVDELHSNAINAAKGKRQSKHEKIIAGLVKMGMSQADAEKTVTAGSLLATIRNKGSEKLNQQASADLAAGDLKPKFVNPFELQEKIDAAKIEEASELVQAEDIKEEIRVALPFANPFAK
jgi:hypothetical protein